MENPKILIEDEHLIAVHKQAGELVVADRWGKEPRILLHQLGEYLRAKGHQKDDSGRDLYPVHRLDRDTSGVVLFAKHQEAHKRLSKLFESREMDKLYWAFVVGDPEWDLCKCDIPLSRAEGKKGRGRALVDMNKGKAAATEFKVAGRYGDISWIEAHPLTGRLHQIRVHLKALGHPLVVDEDYGFPNWQSAQFPSLKISRMPLHARLLSFKHPFTDKKIEISCPMDEELRSLFHTLQQSLK